MSLPFEIEKLREEIRSQIEKLGAELIDIHFRKSSGRSALVLMVDKPSGITLDDCADINRRLGEYLDGLSEESSFLNTPYYLEVNSPGLDRPLKTKADFERAAGQKVRVAYKSEQGAGLVCVGKVLGFEGELLNLQSGGDKKVSIPLNAITKASREIQIGK